MLLGSRLSWALDPSRGGLGLRSLLHHSSACFIASIGHSGIAIGENHHLEQSIDEFDGFIADTEAICLQDILDAPPRQRHLSSKIEDHQLKVLFDHSSSPANHARLLSVSSPHACLGLAFGNAKSPAELIPIESPEFQVALNGGLEWTPLNTPAVHSVLCTPLTPWVTTLLLVKVEATQSSGTILCGIPSGNRVSWPVLQVKSRQAVA